MLSWITAMRWQSKVLVILLAILLVSQGERLSQQGTILGYQLITIHKSESGAIAAVMKNMATPSKPAAPTRKSQSASPAQLPNQQSLVCQKLSAVKVANVLEAQVEEPRSLIPDRTAPNVTSYCLYRTKLNAKLNPSSRTVSVLYREYKLAADAKRAFEANQNRGKKVDVKKFAEQAYYIEGNNQLVARSDKRVIMINVSKPSSGAIKSLDAALAIAQAGLLK